MYNKTLPVSLAIADLGCSYGPNTLLVISDTIKVVEKICRELNHKSPEYKVFLNDLPGNDFNNVFRSLDTFKENLQAEMETEMAPCYFFGVPGSFYGKIFPNKSLHFVHSSYSLQFLSKFSQRKSLEEAMKSLQEKIQKGGYSGGSGSKPPGGRGSGGGGGRGSSGGSEEGSFGGMSDETLQIVFATIGFIFVYIYVINGVEFTKLARDFIKYLLGGAQSVRLKRASYKLAPFYKKVTGQKEVDENGLEKAPTQWNIADFYRDVLRNYMKPNSNE